jgi:branched-chain amino acid transport system ATP-binding protein
MTQITTHGLTAFYGDFQALFGVDIELSPGIVTAIIGANGAGKSTFMKALMGLVTTAPDMIRVDGKPAGGREAHKTIATGVALVPEGRRLFSSLSVEENLRMGTHAGRPGPWSLDRIYELFPILKERKRQNVTQLSGGQQQMVSIGRALLANPSVLLCDEISLGLAPNAIEDLYRALNAARGEGMTVVIVEQDIHRALAVAGQAYCLQEGRVSLSGRPAEFSEDAVRLAYFGV